MSQHARSEPPHGTMAEEAARLADVAHLWLASQSFGRPGAGGSGGTAGAATDSGDVWAEATAAAAKDGAAAHGVPPECQGCPYCRLRRVVGDVSPEVLTHVTSAVASLAAALRALDDPRSESRP